MHFDFYGERKAAVKVRSFSFYCVPVTGSLLTQCFFSVKLAALFKQSSLSLECVSGSGRHKNMKVYHALFFPRQFKSGFYAAAPAAASSGCSR